MCIPSACCDQHPEPLRAAGEMKSLEGLRKLQGCCGVKLKKPHAHKHQVRVAQGEPLIAGSK